MLLKAYRQITTLKGLTNPVTGMERLRYDEHVDDAWERLPEPERIAVHVWGSVHNLGALLQQTFEDRDKAVMVPNMEAANIAMGWHRVPGLLRSRVWAGVQLLNDLTFHKGENLHASICFHPSKPMVWCDSDRRKGGKPACVHCARRWRCQECGDEYVLHTTCSGERPRTLDPKWIHVYWS